ncbi:MAG: FTR1 family protein, partial [Chloroflexi bacterium]|nr:FTR1 family protein [Chloroflexota bacterium]
RALETEAAHALLTGSVLALVAMAFLAVLREGLETAIFMLAAFQSSLDPAATGAGALLGVAVAIFLGYLLYRGGVRINLARFFGVTGFVLVLVAAGLLATSVHEFAEAGVITAGQGRALDLSWLVAPGTVQGALLTGMFGFQPTPTLAELGVWLAYGLPMALYVLWPQRPQPRRPAPSQAGIA